MDVTVVGASGYSGGEALRILARHPKVDKINATSRQYAGDKVSTVHQNLQGIWEGRFMEAKAKAFDVDLIFMATPHGESMKEVPGLLEKGIKVIDLSADYRMKDVRLYERFYQKHTSPELCKKAVYGLPEAYRKEIKKAELVANPGCYPTSVILGLLPLKKFKGKLDIKKVTVDSMSGTSGAGAKPTEFVHHSEVSENLKAYKIGEHRHRPEMESILKEHFGQETRVSFTPTLVPIVRGIQSNIHVYGNVAADLMGGYRRFYSKEFFVRVTKTPSVKNVNRTNYCDVGVWYDKNSTQITVVSVIDNLVKGAAGQAVQNMNIMQGFDETAGLKEIAGHP